MNGETEKERLDRLEAMLKAISGEFGQRTLEARTLIDEARADLAKQEPESGITPGPWSADLEGDIRGSNAQGVCCKPNCVNMPAWRGENWPNDCRAIIAWRKMHTELGKWLAHYDKPGGSFDYTGFMLVMRSLHAEAEGRGE